MDVRIVSIRRQLCKIHACRAPRCPGCPQDHAAIMQRNRVFWEPTRPGLCAGPKRTPGTSPEASPFAPGIEAARPVKAQTGAPLPQSPARGLGALDTLETAQSAAHTAFSQPSLGLGTPTQVTRRLPEPPGGIEHVASFTRVHCSSRQVVAGYRLANKWKRRIRRVCCSVASAPGILGRGHKSHELNFLWRES